VIPVAVRRYNGNIGLSPAQQQVVCVDRGYWRLVLTQRSDVVSGTRVDNVYAASEPTQQQCGSCSRWTALHGSTCLTSARHLDSYRRNYILNNFEMQFSCS
jgi:hypothetical protein